MAVDEGATSFSEQGFKTLSADDECNKQ